MGARRWIPFLVTVYFLIAYALLTVAFLGHSVIVNFKWIKKSELLFVSFVAFLALLIITFQLLNLRMAKQGKDELEFSSSFLAWHSVFFIANILAFIGVLIVCVFLSGEAVHDFKAPKRDPRILAFYISWGVFTLCFMYNVLTVLLLKNIWLEKQMKPCLIC